MDRLELQSPFSWKHGMPFARKNISLRDKLLLLQMKVWVHAKVSVGRWFNFMGLQ